VTALVALLGLVLLSACGDDAGGTTKVDPTEREAEAWVQVLETVGLAGLPPPAEGDALPVLFALEADGGLVPAGVQVAVIKAMKDSADVRFLDEREGAIEHDQPGEPVKDDGTLVVVSEIPPAGGQVEVDVERYRAAADRTEFVVVLRGGNPTWVVASVDPPV
jgi:hypothetical protein